ncbi:hypothetical protein GCM10009706_00290 [Curtobacterium citreum]|nr:hypothetical protein GCM10009706_00290 [Curtobacterium citreum]
MQQVPVHVLGDPPRDAVDVAGTGEDLHDTTGEGSGDLGRVRRGVGVRRPGFRWRSRCPGGPRSRDRGDRSDSRLRSVVVVLVVESMRVS